jgi:hypothetical protein
MKWGYNWELGPFETWDALGFEARRRPDEEGRREALPESILTRCGERREGFYNGGRVYDLEGGVRRSARSIRAPRRSSSASAGGSGASRTTAPRRGISATACSG